MPEPSPKRRSGPAAGAVVIGSEIAGFAVVGVLIDYATGGFDGIPWATLILSPLGIVVAMVHLMKFLPKPPGAAE